MSRKQCVVCLLVTCAAYVLLLLPPFAPLILMPICASLAILCSGFLIIAGPTLMDRLFGLGAALPALAILISILLSAIT